MENTEIYKTPKSNLESNELKNTKKYGFWQRFYISFLWGFPIYMTFVLTGTPKEAWSSGALGSVLFAVGSGLISMLIPFQRKLAFVPPGIIIGVISAAALGFYISGQYPS